VSAGADDLFSAGAADRLLRSAPLAARMRPRTLDEVVGQRHLLGPGKPLRALIQADRLSSVILWGPPGVGKTTIARLMAGATSKAFEPMSAVTAGVKDVREVVERARTRLGHHGQGTMLFLDEIHRFNRAQQDALLPHVEEGLVVLVGATTENPFFEVNPPLLSRSTLFRLEAIEPAELEALVDRALADPERGLGARAATGPTGGAAGSSRPVTITAEARHHLADRAGGDARHVLTCLEVAAALAQEAQRDEITLDDAEAAIASRALRYDRDEHYDVISAFIKSIRGSDPDAGLYWLARMLEAGEDARFIARRLVILASEDVGMADSRGLLIATAAAHAVEYVGLPEAQFNLAHAVVYLATAPKSNRSTMAIGAARADVRERPAGRVPVHLRDGHYQGAATLGHGVGYVYPHADPAGWVDQEHRPAEVAGRRYYEPSEHGEERRIGERRSWLRSDGEPRGGDQQATDDRRRGER
jgi:putative ATPase